MGVPTGDFIGFKFGDYHSTQLGICRVSDGNRYNDTFLPTLQDKTTQVPGGDGTFYFGSYFTQKPIAINIAFDELTEVQYQKIGEVFGDKKIHPLIFDDHPYKVYYAKVTGSPQLKIICFDDPYTHGRVYKGEGTLNFTCYYPYAESQFNYIEDYYDAGYKNVDEWAAASHLQENRYFYDENGEKKFFDTFAPQGAITGTDFFSYVYNKTLPIEWKVFLPLGGVNGKMGDLTVSLVKDGETLHHFKMEGIEFTSDVSLIEIDSETRLIKLFPAVNSAPNVFEPTTDKFVLLNRKITEGDFFKIENNGFYEFHLNPVISGISNYLLDSIRLEYKYRYF